MAMSEPALRSSLLSLFREMRDAPMSEETYAALLAQIITVHVRTATVTVNPGIPVATPAGPGSTNGPGTGSLS